MLVCTFKTSSSVTSSGSVEPNDSMPTSSQAFFLLRTYVSESFLLPTNNTAKPGLCQQHSMSQKVQTNCCKTYATVKHLAVLFSELDDFCCNLFPDGLSNGLSIYKFCLLGFFSNVCLHRLSCRRPACLVSCILADNTISLRLLHLPSSCSGVDPSGSQVDSRSRST